MVSLAASLFWFALSYLLWATTLDKKAFVLSPDKWRNGRCNYSFMRKSSVGKTLGDSAITPRGKRVREREIGKKRKSSDSSGTRGKKKQWISQIRQSLTNDSAWYPRVTVATRENNPCCPPLQKKKEKNKNKTTQRNWILTWHRRIQRHQMRLNQVDIPSEMKPGVQRLKPMWSGQIHKTRAPQVYTIESSTQEREKCTRSSDRHCFPLGLINLPGDLRGLSMMNFLWYPVDSSL